MISREIKSKLKLVAFSLITFFAIPKAANALPAFPGSEGWGSTTVGGRGGTVIKVMNTNDSGPGSLRAALTASGPRIVIFTIGGTITLSSDIVISNPYITVAGQTAPGGGIQIKGRAIRVRTHDVIVRGLRFRPGISGDSNGDALGLESQNWGGYNIVVDHCSIEWAYDENSNIVYPHHDVTYSWNIIAEGLLHSGSGSYGMLISEGSDVNNPTHNISIHHNLFAHNRGRNPQIKQSANAEVINNLMYNWGNYGIATYSESAWIGNHFIAGPSTSDCRGLIVSRSGEWLSLQPGTVFVSHNIGPLRPNDTGDEWNIVGACGSITYKASSPTFILSNISVDPVNDVKNKILAGAGATAPTRDSVDTRIVNSVNSLTGAIISDPTEVGGWPVLAAGASPSDSDNDGIPDAWETAHGLNPNNASDANMLAPSNYTWIEEYINSFFPVSGTPPQIPQEPIPQTIFQVK